MEGGESTALAKRIHLSRLSAYLPWIICGLAAFFYFYELCLRVALGTMVPEVRTALNISLGQIGLLSAFYYYAYTPMQIAAGALIDRLGPRKLLIIMILLCAFGSYLFAHTSLFVVAAVAQGFIGFASAFAFVGVMKLASNWLPKKYVSLVAGVATSLGMIGAMVSNILVAFAMRSLGWRGVWDIFCIFGVVLMVVIYLICVNKPMHKASEPTRSQLKWADIKQDLFIMLKSPFFWVNGIIGGLLYFPTTSFASLWGVPYVVKAFHVDKLAASTVVSMIFLGWAVGGPLVGWLSAQHMRKKTLLITGSLIALVLMVLAILPIHFSMFAYGSILFLFGVASSVEVLVFDLSAKLFNGRSAGTVASLTNFILMLVCTILQPVIGFVIDANQSVAQYRLSLLIIPVGLVLAFILSAFVYKEKKI